MVPFYKIVKDNLIPGFGTNGPDKFEGMEPIKEEEYKALQEMMAHRPDDSKSKAGKMYILQNDPLKWIQIDILDPEEDKKEE